MSKIWSITTGLAAIACFSGERLIVLYCPNGEFNSFIMPLQYGFFVMLLCQACATTCAFLKEPDKHLDGGVLALLVVNVFLLVVSIVLFHVIIRLCNFLVYILGPLLPQS
jgi:hypothetical protein